MHLHLDNQLALVTASTGGIGLEIARALVSDNGTAAGTQQTIAAFPAVDILVNNLGIYESLGFFDETDADWLRIFEVNILSGVRLSRHYRQRMLEKKSGRVIFISSE